MIPRPAILHMDSAGPLRFPGDPFLDFAAFSDPGRSGKRLARSGVPGAAPMMAEHKGTLVQQMSWLNSAASSTPVYASRRTLPNATQHSVPAGGLRLCRAVESRGGAPALGSGGGSDAFASGLSPAPMATFPHPRSSNRTCPTQASGFRTRSCLRPRMASARFRKASEAKFIP